MATEKSEDIEDLKAILRRNKDRKQKDDRKPIYLGTGSTLLNLACANRWSGGWQAGRYYLLVGDSSSGKTFLSLTCLAEAMNSEKFKNYRIILDDVEGGVLMDIEKFFGKRVAERLEAPAYNKDGTPKYSKTVEDFYFNHKRCQQRAKEEGRGVIYILDSENALKSEADDAKFEEAMEANESGKEVNGSYGTAKAKYHSNNLPSLCADIRDTNSITVFISQTRDNLGFGFEKKTRSGGRALKFYASLEMWSSVKERIVKTVKGKPRRIGIVAEIHVKKNRITGKDRTVTMDIYYSVGIDDVGSCVDYLLEEKHWTYSKKKLTPKEVMDRPDDEDEDEDGEDGGDKKPKKKKKGGRIDAPEFEFVGTRDALIQHIEENGREIELRKLVAQVWNEIEEACVVERKPRYA